MRRAAGALAVLFLITAIVVPLGATAAGARGPTRASDHNGNKIFDNLDAAMAGKPGSARVDVIALFAGGTSSAHIDDVKADLGPFDVKYEYQTISGVAARMTIGQVHALAARSDTVQIQLDERIELMLESAQSSSGSTKARPDFGVDGNNETGACPGLKEYCPDDVVVAVLDSGVSNGHVDLDGGKILRNVDCQVTSPDPCWNGGGIDMDGHGTHIASIIAGDGDGNAANVGVAPGAALVNVKIANSYTTVSWMDSGLEWVIQNKSQYGIDALNLSAGTNGWSDGTESTSRLINRAAAAGIVPFVAGGNSGANGLRTTGSPAAAKFSITVGAMSDPGTAAVGYSSPGFNLWHSSGRGPTADGRTKPDVVAPGVDIYAADAGTTNGYKSSTGTSMSSPFAAGVGALMLDANPAVVSSGTACASDDTSTECTDGVVDSSMNMALKDALRQTAVDWGPAGADNHYGHGRLDAYAAVDAASILVGTGGPPIPQHTFSEDSLSGTGAVKDHTISVTGTKWPISVTLVMPTAIRTSGVVSPDFAITLRDPNGNQVAKSPVTNTMQETIGFIPTVTGNYTLRVTSVEGSGAYWFDASFDGDPPPPPPSAPPAAPTGLTATAASSTQINLSWSNVADESGYRIERSANGIDGWTQVGTTGADVVTFSNTGLTSSTTYHYRVIATNAAGNSLPSNTASATTSADTTAPTAPTNLKASSGKLKVSLTWTGSTDSGGSGLAGYKVYRATSSTGTYSHIGTTSATTTSYTDTNVSKGKTYWYYVKAYDRAANHSAASNTVTGKPT